jgi:5-methylthioribose kinase
MIELSRESAWAYLRDRGYQPLRIAELGGGVSNTVLLVETSGERFVLKQSLGRLRVAQEWLSERERIFRESAALRMLSASLSAGSLPEVLFEDRENYLFAMTAAPQGWMCWKDLLLTGQAQDETAATVGRLLACMVRSSWNDATLASQFGDQTVFDQLRIDPYYRATARRHPDLAPAFERLIAESAARRVSLVHGDWSPKNFIVSGAAVFAIDFEVIHYGDPAFDAAFLLNHLTLKAFLHPEWRDRYRRLKRIFWDSYAAGLPAGAEWIEAATMRHLGCLMLARVDGKSPAEYLIDPELKDRVRTYARALILDPPTTIS